MAAIIDRLLQTPGFVQDARIATTEGLRSKYCPEVSYSQTYRAQQLAKAEPITPQEKTQQPVTRTTADGDSFVFLGDTHCPFQDSAAIDAALQVIQEFHPTGIYLLGDMIDCYSVSRFDRDPQRVLQFQDEIDSLRGLLNDIILEAPAAEIHYLLGNHEVRVNKWLHSHPEVSSLECLEPSVLFGLNDYGIIHHEEGEIVRIADHVVTHGSVVRKGSGASARGQIDNYLTSGISGHTHRASHVFRKSLDTTFQWIECGCLTKLKPDYIVGPADWQHAVAVGRIIDSKLNLQLVPINSGKVVKLW